MQYLYFYYAKCDHLNKLSSFPPPMQWGIFKEKGDNGGPCGDFKYRQKGDLFKDFTDGQGCYERVT